MRFEDPTAFEIEFDPMKKRMSGYTVHGMMSFNVPLISEIADNLFQGGCQRGLILPENIQHLVSLYKWEEYKVNHDLATSLTVEMYDSLDQVYDQVNDIALWVNACRKTGPVLVHCQAGLNRSSLVAARALMYDGLTAQEAIDLLRKKRSSACLCNTAFVKHLHNIQKGL